MPKSSEPGVQLSTAINKSDTLIDYLLVYLYQSKSLLPAKTRNHK